MLENQEVYRNRILHLQHLLSVSGAGAALVFDTNDVFYLTGLWSSNALVLLTHDNATLFTDFRYAEVAGKSVKCCRVVVASTDIIAVAADNCNASESESITRHGLAFCHSKINFIMAKSIQNAFKTDNLVNLDSLMTSMRMIKSETEIQAIRQSLKISEDILKNVFSKLKSDVSSLRCSEKDVQLDVRKQIIDNYSEEAFETIVAFGTNTSNCHAVPQSQLTLETDAVLIDMGAKLNRYCSDITRTVVFNSTQDSQKLTDIFNVVSEAKTMVFEKIAPGMRCCDVDKIARDCITSYGYGEFFGHSLGHGVGLDIHEEPRLSSQSMQILEPGMVVTVEPGIYIPGLGGVRLEDMIVITRNGSEVLNALPNRL